MEKKAKYAKVDLTAEAELLLAWFKADVYRFWLKDFAVERGYSSQRFSEWAARSEVFKDALAQAKDIQESRLVHKGMTKDGQSWFIMQMLKNVAGWRDTKDVNLGGGDKPITLMLYGQPEKKEKKPNVHT